MQAPGGNSSLCLGGDPAGSRGGVSSNRFASGANQNAGNVITDRPTTRIHHGPGGATSICLGQDTPDPAPRYNRSSQQQAAASAAPWATAPEAAPAAARGSQGTSANVFATGANQNAGNFITDRPTSRVLQGPGGNSSFCLGGGDPEPRPAPRSSAPAPQAAAAQDVVFGARNGGGSSNAYANGANQNAGNVITDRPSTRVHYGPGGATSICLGGYEEKPVGRPNGGSVENRNTMNVPGRGRGEVTGKVGSAPAPAAAAPPQRGQMTSSQIVFG